MSTTAPTADPSSAIPTSGVSGTRPVIDVDSLRSRLAAAAPLRVLDVRTPAEFETVHIPGSYSVPLATLTEHREELRRHLDDDVVLVCRSGARAQRAGAVLAGAGLPSVRVLEGGMNAWENTAAPVNRGRVTCELERQVRMAAGSLVAAGVLGSTAAPKLKWLSAAVGGGLVFAAATNTCAMGNLLSRMPWNRVQERDDLDDLISALQG